MAAFQTLVVEEIPCNTFNIILLRLDFPGYDLRDEVRSGFTKILEDTVKLLVFSDPLGADPINHAPEPWTRARYAVSGRPGDAGRDLILGDRSAELVPR